jgi:hypothetical protein
MAIFNEAIDDRVRFMFEDAQVRAFKADLLHVLEVVDLPDAAAAELRSKLGRKRPSANAGTRKKLRSPAKTPQLSFERQLAMFLREFPLGFEDAKFVLEERGVGNDAVEARDAVIARVQSKLSRTSLEQGIAAGKQREIYQTVRKLMESGKTLITALEKPDSKGIALAAQPAFVQALYELLYGTGDYEARFEAWIVAMQMKPRATWPVATYLQALVHPTSKIFIKRSFFRAQAAILDMDATSDPIPSGPAHGRLLGVAQQLSDRLVRAGHKPRDLWDVYSFTWRTLAPRPAAVA